MADASGAERRHGGSSSSFPLPAPAAPTGAPRYGRVARVLIVGCLLSLGLFTIVYGQVWAYEGVPSRHWLPWVVLCAGLAITLYAVSDLLTTLGHAARHEDVARTRTRELAANRDRAREVLARIRDAVVVTDPDGYVLEWNEAASTTLDRNPAEARGRHCKVALGIRSPSRPLDCRQGCALLRQVEETGDNLGVEVLRDREDGTTQPLLATVGAVREDGRVVEVVHSLRDITRLRQADDAKTMFLATTSHELRTPLAVIRGFAEMLAHREVDAATRDTALTTILRRVEQLTDMVDALLQTSRLERRGVDLHPDLVDPVPVVAARLDDLRATYGREVRFTGERDTLVAWADPVALGTVIDHLVENAIKYSPDGGPVTVACGPAPSEPGKVHLTVTDEGIGMDPETAEHVFDRFWQADQGDDRRFAGTGVGLYLVRSLVEGMGGRVTVDSRLGAGSTFRLVLRTQPAPDVDGRRPPPRTPRGSLVGEVLHQAGVSAHP